MAEQVLPEHILTALASGCNVFTTEVAGSSYQPYTGSIALGSYADPKGLVVEYKALTFLKPTGSPYVEATQIAEALINAGSYYFSTTVYLIDATRTKNEIMAFHLHKEEAESKGFHVQSKGRDADKIPMPVTLTEEFGDIFKTLFLDTLEKEKAIELIKGQMPKKRLYYPEIEVTKY